MAVDASILPMASEVPWGPHKPRRSKPVTGQTVAQLLGATSLIVQTGSIGDSIATGNPEARSRILHATLGTSQDYSAAPAAIPQVTCRDNTAQVYAIHPGITPDGLSQELSATTGQEAGVLTQKAAVEVSPFEALSQQTGQSSIPAAEKPGAAYSHVMSQSQDDVGSTYATQCVGTGPVSAGRQLRRLAGQKHLPVLTGVTKYPRREMSGPELGTERPRRPEGLESWRGVTGEGEAQGNSERDNRQARRKAHRVYTQKSREKVNSRFNALMEALPPPPPRVNPRSKAEILQYSVQQVLSLRMQNTKLEMRLALTSEHELVSWMQSKTQGASTVREVCQPLIELFCIGMGWDAGEAWAIDSRAPLDAPALGQAWAYTPPQMTVNTEQTQLARTHLDNFLKSGSSMFFSTSSVEAISAAYCAETPVWMSFTDPAARLGTTIMAKQCERTQYALDHGISDTLIVPLRMYGQVQVVASLYAIRQNSEADQSYVRKSRFDPINMIQKAEQVVSVLSRSYSISGSSQS